MATNPLNRRPSTKTGQIRSAPPAAKRTTPSQRMAPIEDPELLPISVGRQIRGHQTDQPKGYDDPADGTRLAHTRAQISAAENGNGSRHDKGDGEGNQGRVGREGGRTS